MKKQNYLALCRTMPTTWLAVNLKVPGKWQSNTHLKLIAIALRERGALQSIGLRSNPWKERGLTQ